MAEEALYAGWILKNPVGWVWPNREHLSRGELGDSLGSLRDSMLGKFSRKHQANSSLDLAAGQGCLLVVGGKLSSFSGNALKDIIDEGVHDRHALLGDSSVRVDLLEHLVDVGRVSFSTLLGLALASGGLLGGLGRLLGGCLGHGGKWRL
jgi:hypothetical protein